MDKKEFIAYAKEFIELRSPELDGISPKTVERIIYSIFESIVTVIERGDEVRFSPVGIFFPRIVQRGDALVASKIGFESFSAINTRLFEKFSKLPIFSSKQSTIRVFAANGALKVTDEEGKELYSLTQAARMANVSLPTAHKYKEKYKDRIPVVKTQQGNRYSESAVEVFKQIKLENIQNTKVKNTNYNIKFPSNIGEFSLSAISKMTSTSMPTLYKYMKKYPDILDPYVHQIDNEKKYSREFAKKVVDIKNSNMSQFGQ